MNHNTDCSHQMISETHESMESGFESVSRLPLRRKQVTFQSYTRRNIDNFPKVKSRCSGIDLITTYKRDFSVSSVLNFCEKKPKIDVHIDAQFNRRPKYQFGLVPSAPTKFMDDALYQINEERKKINFFRQLRNVSYMELK